MKEVNDLELGKRIRFYREKANLSQYSLYEKTKISTTQLSSYENGKRSIGLQSLAKISLALGVTIDELYYGPSASEPINKANNKGELIVNCVSALFDENVIAALYKEKNNPYVEMGAGHFYKIGFRYCVSILDDMVLKLSDFEKNKDNYPDPEGFRKQILASAAKQINDVSKNK